MEMIRSFDRRRRADPDGDRSPDEVLLFAYGTLRHGMPMASLLHDCRWEGTGRIAGTLYDLGAYPALTLAAGGVVEGDLWACDPETLHAVDAYEGVGEGLFERVSVQLENRRCWTYVAGPTLRGQLTEARKLSSGRWSHAKR